MINDIRNYQMTRGTKSGKCGIRKINLAGRKDAGREGVENETRK
jgi:hypothetical protein